MTDIPDIYKPGVERLENLNTPAMYEWLRAELFEKIHILPGQADDFPVQAIVNHHKYLTIAAQSRFADATRLLVQDWRDCPTDWTEAAARALLDLATDTRAEVSKSALESLVSTSFRKIDPRLQPPVLRALASFSTSNDRTFWQDVWRLFPKFAGLAFQVLSRISPLDAIQSLGSLPDEDNAIQGVARKLPALISQFERERHPEILAAVSRSLAAMPMKTSQRLIKALEEEGLPIPTEQGLRAKQVQKMFSDHLDKFFKGISLENDIQQVYARAR